MNKLQVEAIQHGTVIDHIPAGMGVKILKFFQLTSNNEPITIGLNLRSHHGGKKDLIKIENTTLSKAQADQLALFANNATINQISDYKVINKFTVERPAYIDMVLQCPNSNCITQHQCADTRFYVSGEERTILKCHYCEKSFDIGLFQELK